MSISDWDTLPAIEVASLVEITGKGGFKSTPGISSAVTTTPSSSTSSIISPGQLSYATHMSKKLVNRDFCTGWSQVTHGRKLIKAEISQVNSSYPKVLTDNENLPTGWSAGNTEKEDADNYSRIDMVLSPLLHKMMFRITGAGQVVIEYYDWLPHHHLTPMDLQQWEYIQALCHQLHSLHSQNSGVGQEEDQGKHHHDHGHQIQHLGPESRLMLTSVEVSTTETPPPAWSRIQVVMCHDKMRNTQNVKFSFTPGFILDIINSNMKDYITSPSEWRDLLEEF